MKSKKMVFATLEIMLAYYDNFRFILKMTEADAVKKTLETYSDFYEWLTEKKEITQSVEEYLESPQGREDTLALMVKSEALKEVEEAIGKEKLKSVRHAHDHCFGKERTIEDVKEALEPVKKVKRGRKKGDMMSCDKKIMKYAENKANFKLESLIKRYPRFSEDEIMKAVSKLISDHKLRQMPGGVLEVLR